MTNGSSVSGHVSCKPQTRPRLTLCHTLRLVTVFESGFQNIYVRVTPPDGRRAQLATKTRNISREVGSSRASYVENKTVSWWDWNRNLKHAETKTFVLLICQRSLSDFTLSRNKSCVCHKLEWNVQNIISLRHWELMYWSQLSAVMREHPADLLTLNISEFYWLTFSPKFSACRYNCTFHCELFHCEQSTDSCALIMLFDQRPDEPRLSGGGITSWIFDLNEAQSLLISSAPAQNHLSRSTMIHYFQTELFTSSDEYSWCTTFSQWQFVLTDGRLTASLTLCEGRKHTAALISLMIMIHLFPVWAAAGLCECHIDVFVPSCGQTQLSAALI